MAGKFGFHSGQFTAKNIVAGSFIISGAINSRKHKAITFPRKFRGDVTPVVVSTQWAGVVGSSSYEYMISGVSQLAISGITASGFTAVQNFTAALNEDSDTASGVRYMYVAYDFYNKTRQ